MPNTLTQSNLHCVQDTHFDFSGNQTHDLAVKLQGEISPTA